MFGAGHNVLGAWWWLAESGRLQVGPTGGAFVQEIGSARVLSKCCPKGLAGFDGDDAGGL